MFEDIERDGQCVGFSLKQDGATFFFGTRLLTKEDLPKLFPRHEFFFVEQVHGKNVVRAIRAPVEADAHFTNVAGQALVIRSADCLPILLASGSEVCAIHAGWRGLAREIIRAVKLSRPRFQPRVAVIGPHIHRLEVGMDVAAQLTVSTPERTERLSYPHPASPNERVMFDLTGLARAQLLAAFGKDLQIFDCDTDTKEDALFHSHRRDGARAGRQYSFVVINR